MASLDRERKARERGTLLALLLTFGPCIGLALFAPGVFMWWGGLFGIAIVALEFWGALWLNDFLSEYFVERERRIRR